MSLREDCVVSTKLSVCLDEVSDSQIIGLSQNKNAGWSIRHECSETCSGSPPSRPRVMPL
jgi:hypothetical protein